MRYIHLLTYLVNSCETKPCTGCTDRCSS